MLAADAADLQDIRKIMDIRTIAKSQVFETAGGYASTIDSIGELLGLIQVMNHLGDIKQVGHVDVTFVATGYGVVFANLLLLSVGAKMRARLDAKLNSYRPNFEDPTLTQGKLGAYQEESTTSTKTARQATRGTESRSVA